MDEGLQREANAFLLEELNAELASLKQIYSLFYERSIKYRILTLKKEISNHKYYFCV
jgi:hypothetical protein